MANRVAKSKSQAGRAEKPASVLYLYGISREKPPSALSARGVDGVSQVESIAAAGLHCWVSRVNRGEFADRIEANMERLDWLADASVRHQRVVAELCARATTVPARFGAVFLAEASLVANVEGRKRALQAIFERIAGADEWGVKVFAEPQAAPPPSAPAASSGREYLQRKAKTMQAPRGRTLDPAVVEFANALAKVARATAPAGKVSAGQRDLEWQGSFLLGHSERKQWEALLARYASRWNGARRIECTGPWPPYSFVAEESAG